MKRRRRGYGNSWCCVLLQIPVHHNLVRAIATRQPSLILEGVANTGRGTVCTLTLDRMNAQ